MCSKLPWSAKVPEVSYPSCLEEIRNKQDGSLNLMTVLWQAKKYLIRKKTCLIDLPAGRRKLGVEFPNGGMKSSASEQVF